MNLNISLEDRNKLIENNEIEWSDWVQEVKNNVLKTNSMFKGLVEWNYDKVIESKIPSFLISYKDTIDVDGFFTRYGELTGYKKKVNIPNKITTSLDKKNFLSIGKAWTTEFSLGPKCDCINPLFPNFSPGGSSTGSAISVAAGFCDISIGTDSCGSIRWPAGQCGVTGLRLSKTHELGDDIFPFCPSLDSIGVITRTAKDLQYIWQKEDLSGIFKLNKVIKTDDIKYKWVQNIVDTVSEEDVINNFYKTLSIIEDGKREKIDPVNLSWWENREDAFTILWKEIFEFHNDFSNNNELSYSDDVKALINYGMKITEDQYATAKSKQANAIETAKKILNDTVVILPLDPQKPRDLTTPPTKLHELYDELGFTIPASFAHLPSLVLPSGIAPNGAPLAIQLWSAPGNEELLIRAGVEIEKLITKIPS